MDKPNGKKPAVTARLTINCGCGFTAKDSKEALLHAEQTNHQLNVHGVIGTPERLAEGATRVYRAAAKGGKR
jgi:hypothetical protein